MKKISRLIESMAVMRFKIGSIFPEDLNTGANFIRELRGRGGGVIQQLGVPLRLFYLGDYRQAFH